MHFCCMRSGEARQWVMASWLEAAQSQAEHLYRRCRGGSLRLIAESGRKQMLLTQPRHAQPHLHRRFVCFRLDQLLPARCLRIPSRALSQLGESSSSGCTSSRARHCVLHIRPWLPPAASTAAGFRCERASARSTARPLAPIRPIRQVLERRRRNRMSWTKLSAAGPAPWSPPRASQSPRTPKLWPSSCSTPRTWCAATARL